MCLDFQIARAPPGWTRPSDGDKGEPRALEVGNRTSHELPSSIPAAAPHEGMLQPCSHPMREQQSLTIRRDMKSVLMGWPWTTMQSCPKWTPYIAIIMIAVIPVTAIWKATFLVVDVPWGDQLTLLRDAHVFEGFSLTSLFGFHNEHLIVPTKLIIVADYWLTGGSNALPAVCALAFTIGVIGIQVLMLRRKHPEVIGVRLALSAGLLTAVLLNGRMTWTLTCPILLTHVSANFFVITALAACACAAAGGQSRQATKLAICLIAALVAACSSASGVFALPAAGIGVITVVAASGRLSARAWRAPAMLALIGGAAIIAAYSAAHAQFGTSHGVGAPSVSRAVRFAIYFPGGAWFRDGTWPIVHHADPLLLHVVVLGFWALVGVTLVHLWHRRAAVGEFEMFHLATITFVVMTAAAGGMFRGGISEMEALNNKYVPTALLAWAALLSLALPTFLRTLADRPRWIGALTTSCGALACALTLPGDFVEYRAWASHNLDLRCAADSYMNGSRNDHVMRRFFPDPDIARDLLSKVQQSKGYFFRDRKELRDDNHLTLEAPAGNRVARRPDHRDYGLELINDTAALLGKPGPKRQSHQPTVLWGWAVDQEAATCASSVVALVGERTFAATYGLPCPDVASYLSKPAYTNSGFQVILPAGSLAPGRHEIRLRIVLANCKDYLETGAYLVDVEP